MSKTKALTKLIGLSLGITLLFSSSVFASGNTNIKRLGGKDRYETSLKIVSDGWTQSNYVILVNSKMFADAIVSTPLAKKYDAPILLTDSKSLTNSTKQKLQQLNVKNVLIIGGTGVISDNVLNQVKNMGIDTKRIYGKDRYETSVNVGKELGITTGAFVVSGDSWEDALSVSPISAQLQYPILLSSKDKVPSVVKNYINDNKKVIVLGEEDKVRNIVTELKPTKIYDQIDKSARNLALINDYKEKLDLSNIYLASDSSFADALSGSALASKNGNPIVLLGRGNKNQVNNFIENNNIKNINILGGEGVLADDLINGVPSETEAKDYKTVQNLYINKTGNDAIIEEQFNNLLKFTGDHNLYHSFLSVETNLVYRGELDYFYFNVTDSVGTFSCVKSQTDNSQNVSYVYDKNDKTLTLTIKNIDIDSELRTYFADAFQTQYKKDIITDITSAIESKNNYSKDTNYGSISKVLESNTNGDLDSTITIKASIN